MADIGVKVCLIYVLATADRVAGVRSVLELQGYTVCEAEAVDDAFDGDESTLSEGVLDCIANSELCLFLLPEHEREDACLAIAAGAAEANERRVICAYAGQRSSAPEALDEHAESMVRVDGPNLQAAISGTVIWEKPDGQRVAEREIERVRCQ